MIHLAKRPFSSVQEMEAVMIQRWNSKVGRLDTVYYLGDFAWYAEDGRRVLPKLNGRIHLIEGNHEVSSIVKGFQSHDIYREIEVEGQKIVLFHYPIRSWNGAFRGSWHLHGHVHTMLDHIPWGKSMDVGVDSHNFYPVSFEEVREIMVNKPLWTQEAGFLGLPRLGAKLEEVKQ
jgi:calcineurin-like phosphoesterase family protein